MLQKISLSLTGIFLGFVVGYLLFFYTSFFHAIPTKSLATNLGLTKKEVIGFLPYWQLDKAKTDYSPYITELAYFSLSIDSDGSIKKLVNEQEEDPGWHALSSGAVNSFLDTAKAHTVSRSLVIFSGDIDTINDLVADPIQHAQTLVSNVLPLVRTYGFSDLNLDIEKTDTASDAARMGFVTFTKQLKNNLEKNNISLTVDVSTGSLIREHDLIDAKAIGAIPDRVMLMAYDYHSPGSFVTGPIAPLSGAGVTYEYDVETALQKLLVFVPKEHVILGIPLYGNEWETLNSTPRSAVIPDSGVTASNNRVESLLSSCATCSAQKDTESGESHIIYQDTGTGTYHQLFYPDETAMQTKINFAKQQELAGVGLWALGFEGANILTPLKSYK